MKFKKSLFMSATALTGLLSATASYAYPLVDQIAAAHGEAISVFPDHQTPGAYWYIPQSIEPWKKDDLYRSAFYRTDRALTFIFRGQPTVDEAVLRRVAQALGTSINNLNPIAYEYSRNVVCQNPYDTSQVKWIVPSMIGNYLEIVPITMRTTDPDLIEELGTLIDSSRGLACTVEVGFKGVSTAYKLNFTANLNQVYSRFEAAAHAEAFWFEADIHTLVEQLRRDAVISIKTLEDTSIDQTALDAKANAAMDDIIKQITAALFTPALKIPDGPMAGRGKAWSLRVDYRRSEQNNNYQAVLESQKVKVKNSQISIRLSTK